MSEAKSPASIQGSSTPTSAHPDLTDNALNLKIDVPLANDPNGEHVDDDGYEAEREHGSPENNKKHAFGRAAHARQ
jgi:hypothetical protein